MQGAKVQSISDLFETKLRDLTLGAWPIHWLKLGRFPISKSRAPGQHRDCPAFIGIGY